MAKELPYFKFEPSAWDSGTIQLCTWSAKGLFIELCGLYWNRLGELPYALALQKLCKGDETLFKELQSNDIYTINEGQIIIAFLDEQLNDFQNTSEKRRNAANKRWLDANDMQLHNNSNAIREEKMKEDKRKKDKNKTLMSKATASDLSELNVPFFEIAKAFFDLFEKNASDLGVEWLHLKKITADSFTDSIRLMSTVDNRSVNDIRAVWEFLKKDEFWKPNIQSSKKLREKFDQLITKSKTNGNSKTGNGFVEQAHAYLSANDPNYKNL